MPHPLLYEINTRPWLRELSEKAARPITLANVPESEFLDWTRLGFTHLWLMGVWTSGPLARAEAIKTFLPLGLPEADIAASPYAIAQYRVPPALGGEEGLGVFRRRLHQHGLKLVLDFVANHVGPDHPWVDEKSDLFVQTSLDLPETFQRATTGKGRLAYGKDPNFAAWTDTVQLDYRLPATRAAMTELLQSIAKRCDGARCDMAMLLLNDVFAKTWERFPISGSDSLSPSEGEKPRGVGTLCCSDWAREKGPFTPHETPATEFWASAISTIKQAHPDFLFLAEAYWGLEVRLQALGFDYTYDKELHDRLVARDAPGVQRHLLGKPSEFIVHSAHFIENHDEPRIASILSLPEHRAAALVILGLPGMRFLHEGQLDGVREKIPVQLARRVFAPSLEQIKQFYQHLLTAISKTAVGQGRGELLKPRVAWAENPTWENFVIVQWQRRSPDFDLVVVNLAGQRSQCFAPINIENLSGCDWLMEDLLGQERFVREGDKLQTQGLYLDLPAHGAQLFHFRPAGQSL